MGPKSRVWVLVGLTLMAFVSPLRAVWASDGGPWWGSFAAWGALVVITALSLGRGADDAE